jgi:hypothetical protein
MSAIILNDALSRMTSFQCRFNEASFAADCGLYLGDEALVMDTEAKIIGWGLAFRCSGCLPKGYPVEVPSELQDGIDELIEAGSGRFSARRRSGDRRSTGRSHLYLRRRSRRRSRPAHPALRPGSF